MVFALSYVAIQVGRTAFIALQLPSGHALAANYRRMLVWLMVSAVFWIAGAAAEHETRALLWFIAVVCKYGAPMVGFAVPGMGRSNTRDWSIEGGHLAERCQLFVIVALGETLLATGASLSTAGHWSSEVLQALVATFLGTLAMWWLYFGTSSKDASETIVRSDDPGRIGAYFHYVHAILVAGIIATAVGNDLVLGHPHAVPTAAQVAILLLGPAIHFLGSAVYKSIVYGGVAISHIAGAVMLLALVPIGLAGNMLLMRWLTTAWCWWSASGKHSTASCPTTRSATWRPSPSSARSPWAWR